MILSDIWCIVVNSLILSAMYPLWSLVSNLNWSWVLRGGWKPRLRDCLLFLGISCFSCCHTKVVAKWSKFWIAFSWVQTNQPKAPPRGVLPTVGSRMRYAPWDGIVFAQVRGWKRKVRASGRFSHCKSGFLLVGCGWGIFEFFLENVMFFVPMRMPGFLTGGWRISTLYVT